MTPEDLAEQTVYTRLSVHEAVCAERYRSLLGRLGRIEAVLLAATGSMIAALAVIAWTYFKAGIH